MKKLLRKLAKKYLQKTCKHKFKEVFTSFPDKYIQEKCTKCKKIKFSEI